jgi:alpha-glucosidase
MFYHKLPAPTNFTYPAAWIPTIGADAVTLRAESGGGRLRVAAIDGGAFRVTAMQGTDPTSNPSILDFTRREVPFTVVEQLADGRLRLANGGAVLEIDPRAGGRLTLLLDGAAALDTPAAPFGYTGARQILLVSHERDTPLYGMGEKTGPLDKAGRHYNYWNTDVVADHPHTFMGEDFDPGYVSIPVVYTRRGAAHAAVLLNNPRRAWMQTNLDGSHDNLFNPSLGVRHRDEHLLTVGVDSGALDLILLAGPTLADVVARMSLLMGSPTMPPRWALGYHQCRWSYETAAELDDVSACLHECGIPVGAMWMDIDYMDDFRVFTWHRDHFSPEQRARYFAAIRARGTRLVTIIDPGIKEDPDWPVYTAARDARLLCETGEGRPYIGLVWPGRTVFPDYSLPAVRTYWAGLVAEHLRAGIDGIWNDMNDPSTGPIAYEEMRFQHGAAPHEDYHNTYADLMAQATAEGFARHDPDRRPFILTRSGSTGIQRFAAVWTGDNASNEVHLRQSIPMSLNLALSGVSFNGPDVGGFAGDTNEALLAAWYQACFLLPFLRNHSAKGTLPQEPYRFSAETLAIARSCIRTRAMLLPVFESLFRAHLATGAPVIRPLVMEFPGQGFEQVGDVYMLGSSLLLAPLVDTTSAARTVRLPAGQWFSMAESRWVAGATVHEIQRSPVPALFVRDGSIIPAIASDAVFPEPDIRALEFHVFLREATTAAAVAWQDDGETNAWQRGVQNEWHATAQRDGAAARVELRCAAGWTPPAEAATVWFYGAAAAGAVAGDPGWPFGTVAARRAAVPVARA